MERRQAELLVYNLNIDGHHNYAVGERGVLVHNDTCSKPVEVLVRGKITLPTNGLGRTATRYGDFNGLTSRGIQANHLNQNAAFSSIIPVDEGIAVAMRGDAIADVGSPHYLFHESLEKFWQRYRGRPINPTVAEYNQALYSALKHAGYEPSEAKELLESAIANQLQHNLMPNHLVPDIPKPLNQQ